MSTPEEICMKALPQEIQAKTLRQQDQECEANYQKIIKGTMQQKGDQDLVMIHMTLFKKRRELPRKHNNKRLTYRERKRLGLYQLSKTGLSYKEVIPLHCLWQEYMRDSLHLNEIRQQGWNNSPTDSNFESVSLRLYRADFHGCKMTVVRSICPSYVGKTGIVVMETKNCFRLLGEDNIVRTIPKETSEFGFELDEFNFSLFGKNFLCRPAERSSKKIKSVKVHDL